MQRLLRGVLHVAQLQYDQHCTVASCRILKVSQSGIIASFYSTLYIQREAVAQPFMRYNNARMPAAPSGSACNLQVTTQGAPAPP